MADLEVTGHYSRFFDGSSKAILDVSSAPHPALTASFFQLYTGAASSCEYLFYILQDPAKFSSHFLSVHLLFPHHPNTASYCPVLNNEVSRIPSSLPAAWGGE